MKLKGAPTLAHEQDAIATLRGRRQAFPSKATNTPGVQSPPCLHAAAYLFVNTDQTLAEKRVENLVRIQETECERCSA